MISACGVLHGKQKQDDHGRIKRTPRKVGDLWHIDITYHKVQSLGKRKYTLCLVENKTKVDDPQFLRSKSDTGQAVKDAINKYQRQSGKKIKIIHADGAKEFIADGSQLKKWCRERNNSTLFVQRNPRRKRYC